MRGRANPRTVASAAAVVAALAGAAAAGCGAWQPPPPGEPRPRDRPDDSDLAALVPAGVETVIEVDMAALRASPWTEPAVAAARGDGERALRTRGLGYDDLADADRIAYGVPAEGAELPTLALITGRLDRGRIEEAFRERVSDAAVEQWRGITVLSGSEVRAGQAAGARKALAMLTARTFVAGTPATVKAAIDRAFGVGAGIDTDPALGPVRRELLPTGGRARPALLAAASIGPRMRARAEEAMPLPRELRQVGVRLDLGETLDLEAVGMLDDRVAADALTRRLAALLGNRGTRLTMRAMGLGALLAGTRVNAEGARVRLRTVVGADDRPAVSAALRSLLGMVPGPGT